MITAIALILHYYILPEKVYTGINCLEEWAQGVMAWNHTLRMAGLADVVFCSIGLIVSLWMLVNEIKKEKAASSEESES